MNLREQERHARLFVEDHPDWQITAVYDDREASGFKLVRPSFIRLMEDARHHRFDIVIVMIEQS